MTAEEMVLELRFSPEMFFYISFNRKITAVSYHCPIFCLLKFDNNVKSTFSRHFWLYDRGDFNAFCDEIPQKDWHVLKHDNIDTYAENVTTCITELAKKHVLSKTISCRPSGPSYRKTYNKEKATLQ